MKFSEFSVKSNQNKTGYGIHSPKRWTGTHELVLSLMQLQNLYISLCENTLTIVSK